MKFTFFQRRTILLPTLAGWACLIILFGGGTTAWWLTAESFFSVTDRRPADVLVVEGWIGLEGIAAAKAEFERGGYRCLVAAGGPVHNRWDSRALNYADNVVEELLHLGMPQREILIARQVDTAGHRTFASAIAARDSLRAAGIRPKAVNVFTLGPHARRSHLTFAKVFQPDIPVGVISWTQAEYAGESWWRSSERAEDLIKESIGWPYELLLNSGRTSNSTTEAIRPKP
jgi:hypothetical protein